MSKRQRKVFFRIPKAVVWRQRDEEVVLRSRYRVKVSDKRSKRGEVVELRIPNDVLSTNWEYEPANTAYYPKGAGKDYTWDQVIQEFGTQMDYGYDKLKESAPAQSPEVGCEVVGEIVADVEPKDHGDLMTLWDTLRDVSSTTEGVGQPEFMRVMRLAVRLLLQEPGVIEYLSGILISRGPRLTIPHIATSYLQTERESDRDQLWYAYEDSMRSKSPVTCEDIAVVLSAVEVQLKQGMVDKVPEIIRKIQLTKHDTEGEYLTLERLPQVIHEEIDFSGVGKMGELHAELENLRGLLIEHRTLEKRKVTKEWNALSPSVKMRVRWRLRYLEYSMNKILTDIHGRRRIYACDQVYPVSGTMDVSVLRSDTSTSYCIVYRASTSVMRIVREMGSPTQGLEYKTPSWVQEDAVGMPLYTVSTDSVSYDSMDFVTRKIYRYLMNLLEDPTITDMEIREKLEDMKELQSPDSLRVSMIIREEYNAKK